MVIKVYPEHVFDLTAVLSNGFVVFDYYTTQTKSTVRFKFSIKKLWDKGSVAIISTVLVQKWSWLEYREASNSVICLYCSHAFDKLLTDAVQESNSRCYRFGAGFLSC